MTRKSYLTRELQRYVDQTIDQAIRNSNSIGVTDITQFVEELMTEDARAGDLRPVSAQRGLYLNGIHNRVETRLDDDVSRFKLRSGQTVAIPSRIGTKRNTSNGVEHAQTFWWCAPWGDIEEQRNEDAAERDQRGSKVQVWDEVLELRARYPQTRTPKEACDLAGIDPRKWELH